MIKIRVFRKYWDEVIPCALPDLGSRRGRNEDLEKLGLGELYGREYVKKAMILDVYAEEK